MILNKLKGYLTRLSSFGSLFRCLLPIDSNGQVRERGNIYILLLNIINVIKLYKVPSTTTNSVFQGHGYQLLDDSDNQEVLVDAPETKEDYEMRRKFIAMKRNIG